MQWGNALLISGLDIFTSKILCYRRCHVSSETGNIIFKKLKKELQNDLSFNVRHANLITDQ